MMQPNGLMQPKQLNEELYDSQNPQGWTPIDELQKLSQEIDAMDERVRATQKGKRQKKSNSRYVPYDYRPRVNITSDEIKMTRNDYTEWMMKMEEMKREIEEWKKKEIEWKKKEKEYQSWFPSLETLDSSSSSTSTSSPQSESDLNSGIMMSLPELWNDDSSYYLSTLIEEN